MTKEQIHETLFHTDADPIEDCELAESISQVFTEVFQEPENIEYAKLFVSGYILAASKLGALKDQKREYEWVMKCLGFDKHEDFQNN